MCGHFQPVCRCWFLSSMRLPFSTPRHQESLMTLTRRPRHSHGEIYFLECWVCSVQHEITRVLCDVCNCNIHFYNFQFPRSVLSRGGISCHNYARPVAMAGTATNLYLECLVSGRANVLCSGYLYCRHPLIRISCHYCCCYIKFDMCVKSEPGQMTKMS